MNSFLILSILWTVFCAVNCQSSIKAITRDGTMFMANEGKNGRNVGEALSDSCPCTYRSLCERVKGIYTEDACKFKCKGADITQLGHFSGIKMDFEPCKKLLTNAPGECHSALCL